MSSKAYWRRLSAVRSWPRMRLAVWTTAGGLALSSVTVVLSLLKAVSVRWAILMALLAIVMTICGRIGWVVPDARIAWRRGFQHGWEAALTPQTSHRQGDATASGDMRVPDSQICGESYDDLGLSNLRART